MTKESDGIIYPTFLNTIKIGDYDYFKLKNSTIQKFLEPELLESDDLFPDLISVSESKDPIRGNLAYACLDFCSNIPPLKIIAGSMIRSYPLQQLRKIKAFIGQDLLAMDWEISRVASCHALQMIGSLMPVVSFLNCGVASYMEELEDLCHYITEQLSRKIIGTKFYNSVGRIFQYLNLLLYAFELKPNDELGRSLRDYCNKCANEFLNCFENSSTNESRVFYQHQARLLYGMLVCFTSTFQNYEQSDLEIAMIAMLQFRNRNDVIGTPGGPKKPFEQELEVHFSLRVPSIATEISKMLKNNPSMLNISMRTVFKDFPELTWENANLLSSTFTATYQGSLYHIDLMDSIAFKNGQPITTLPDVILNSAVFLRLFRTYEHFPVTKTHNSHVAVLGGKEYEFFIVDQLILISETDSKSQKRQILISEIIDKIFPGLQRILVEKYSHWYEPATKMIYFRTWDLNDVEHVFSAKPDSTGGYSIYWNQTSEYRLVSLSNSTVLNTLHKFEYREFIFTAENAEGKLVYALPRYSLTFIQNSKNQLSCLECEGYVLADEHILPDTLYRFDQYLILERNERSGRKLSLVLIPEGHVIYDDTKTYISVPPDQLKNLKYFQFKVHPRLGTFENSSLLARLTLSCLYALEGSMPDQRFRVAGFQNALSILRHSAVHRPLSAQESKILETIFKNSLQYPALRLISKEFYDRSRKIDFLFADSSAPTNSNVMASCILTDTITAYNEYLNTYNHIPSMSLAGTLADDEKNCTLGRQPIRNQSLHHSVTVLDYSTPDDFVTSLECKLKQSVKSIAAVKDDYPFLNENSSLVGKHIYGKLKKSWEAYQTDCKYTIDHESLDVKEIMALVVAEKAKLFNYILRYTNDTSCPELKIYTILGRKIPGTITNFLRCIVDKSQLLVLNPYLKDKDATKIHKAIILYAQICVLEDRLMRIEDLIAYDPDSEDLVSELRIFRDWNPQEYPEWLVFELQQSISIRNEQYQFACQIINNPNTVSQLDIGLGKTRVILPMVVLFAVLRS
jgi:hypothetical protein